MNPGPIDRAVWLDGRGLQTGFKEHLGGGLGRYVASLAASLDSEALDGRVRVIVERGAAPASTIPRSRFVEMPHLSGGRGAGMTQLRQQAVLAAWLASRRPAAVHFVSPGDAPALVQVPTIITLHDIALHGHAQWLRGRSRRARVRLQVERALERVAIGHAKRVIVPSRVVAEEAIAALGVSRSAIAVIPAAASAVFSAAPQVDDAAVRARLGLPARYVVHTGGADPRKRLPELIAAFDAVAREESDLGLVLVGRARESARGGFDPALARALADAESRERIRLLGVVTEAELATVVRGAAALLLATRYEGFALSALEALACGTPVVATAARAIEEVGGEAAELVPVDAPGESRTGSAGCCATRRAPVSFASAGSSARSNFAGRRPRSRRSRCTRR